MTIPQRSKKLDLVIDVVDVVGDEAATTAALTVRRLKRDPVVPDHVIWYATAQKLDDDGHDVDSMIGQKPFPNPSLVTSILEKAEYDGHSSVTVI